MSTSSASQARAQLDARHSGQADVDDHHVRPAPGNHRQRSLRIWYRRDVETVHSEPSIDGCSHGVVVFDHEHTSGFS